MVFYKIGFVLFLAIFAQVNIISANNDHTIDSLKQVIDSQVPDTTRVQCYQSWKALVYAIDPLKSHEIDLEILKICTENLGSDLNESEFLFFKTYH